MATTRRNQRLKSSIYTLKAITAQQLQRILDREDEISEYQFLADVHIATVEALIEARTQKISNQSELIDELSTRLTAHSRGVKRVSKAFADTEEVYERADETIQEGRESLNETMNNLQEAREMLGIDDETQIIKDLANDLNKAREDTTPDDSGSDISPD